MARHGSFDLETLLVGLIKSVVDFLLWMFRVHAVSTVGVVFPFVNGPTNRPGALGHEPNRRPASASGGRLCNSLIDEFRLDLYPYVAGEGTRLFDDVPKSYRLLLVSSTAFSNGDRRAAVPPAPLTRRPTCMTSGNQASAATCPRGPPPSSL